MTDSKKKEYETEFDKMMAEHSWLMRYEIFKMKVSEFFWRLHPRRNRWCKKCGDFVGNSGRELRAHRCKKEE